MKGSRIVRLIMALALALGTAGATLVGCAGDSTGSPDGGEIVLTVSKCPTKGLPQELMDEMTSRHPNLRFEFDTYSNDNYSTQQVRQLEHHDIPDILINTRSQDLTEDLSNNLVDLAAYDFTSAYLPSVVDRLSVDGHVYYLPGYLSLAGFFYNKDMFAEHGWEVPRSLEDLIALNEEAKSEGVRLLAYSMELVGQRFLHLTNIASAQFLHTPQGTAWEQKFLAGEETMTGTFEPFMDEYQRWIDAGLFTADDFSTTIPEAKTMFENGEVAMLYGMGNDIDSTAYSFELGQAPFFTQGDGEDNAWYMYAVSSYYGISKRLEEPGNEEKLAIALEMFEFMSTPEGQEMLKEGGTGRYPATKESDDGFRTPLLSDYYDVVDRNNLVEFVAYAPVLTTGGNALTSYMEGSISAEEALRLCDEAMKDNKSESQMGDVLTAIERDLNAEETVRYFADAFRDYQKTDLCLMLPGGNREGEYHHLGVAGRLYAGELHANELTVLLPYTGEVTTLATASVTGGELRSMLGEGRVFEQDTATGGESHPFYYQVSGAEVDYGDDHAVRSLMVNGREVADDDVFTVAYFNGAVDESRVSEAEVTDEKPVPAMTAYLK